MAKMQDAIVEKYEEMIDSGKLELGPNTGLGITVYLDGSHEVEVRGIIPGNPKIQVLAAKEVQ